MPSKVKHQWWFLFSISLNWIVSFTFICLRKNISVLIIHPQNVFFKTLKYPGRTIARIFSLIDEYSFFSPLQVKHLLIVESYEKIKFPDFRIELVILALRDKYANHWAVVVGKRYTLKSQRTVTRNCNFDRLIFVHIICRISHFDPSWWCILCSQKCANAFLNIVRIICNINFRIL